MNNEKSIKRIRSMLEKGSRLNIDIDELRHFNSRLATFVMKRPLEAIKMFEEHLN